MRALARLERMLAPEKSYEVRFVLAFVRLCSKDTLNQIVASIGDVSGKSLSDKQFICLADLSDLREG